MRRRSTRRSTTARWRGRTAVRAGAAAGSLAAALALAGCGGGGADRGAIVVEQMPGLVLQPVDVGATFRPFAVGKLSSADVQPGPREDPERFGRIDGWKVRYRRPESAARRGGAIVLESRVDLFADDAGAEEDFAAYEQEFGAVVQRAGGRAQRLAAPDLGEQALAVSLRQRSDGTAMRFFALAWQQENVTALVIANGFEGRITLADALTLARKQERRIERAARAD